MENNGYLYCVYSKDGEPNKFLTKEFLVSYNSLKKTVPNCNVTLHTNIKLDNAYGIENIIYDEDITTSHIAKAESLLKSPYDKTILLDTDTIIHRPIINDIFKVLDEFDFTCCYGNYWNKGTIYPDLNTGLIGVKKNNFTTTEINTWIKEFKKKGQGSDQKGFRNIFMNNKNKFHILPTYFMYRWHHYKDYPNHAVLTHSHSMSKNEVTKKIFRSLLDSILNDDF